MEIYLNTSKKSGVIAYEYGSNYIKVQFSRGGSYIYSYESAGKEHIEKMKQLADSGSGLNTYINKNVKKNYEKKC